MAHKKNDLACKGMAQTHCDYEFAKCRWKKIRDAIEGEERVKYEGILYLPKPPGMVGPTMSKEAERYRHYLSFAELPEILGPARDCFQAVLHHKPARFDLPPEMEYLRETATPMGEPLDELWANLTHEVITTGRCPLLADVAPDDRMYLAWHEAESLINWRKDPFTGQVTMAVFCQHVDAESAEDEYQNVETAIYRALRLQPLSADPDELPPEEGEIRAPALPVYTQTVRVGDDEEFGPIPVIRQGAPLREIPLTVVNSNHIGLNIGPSPIQEMANCVMRAYKYSADWVRARYIKADPVAVIVGPLAKSEVPTRIGGETLWHFSDPAVQTYYLDINGDGLPILRQAVIDQYDAFIAAGGRLLQISDRTQPESGAALRERQAAHAMSLQSIARTCASGLERALRQMARLMGADPDLVRVVPDTDFAQEKLAALAMLNAIVARKEGFPISEESLHETARRSGWTEKSFEEEKAQIEEEGPSPGQEPRGAPEEDVTEEGSDEG